MNGETVYSRGFRNKDQASKWIDGFTGSPFAPARLDWRVGFVFRLRGVDFDFEIVRRDGKPLETHPKRQRVENADQL